MDLKDHPRRQTLSLVSVVFAASCLFLGAATGLSQSTFPTPGHSANRVWSDNSGTFSIEARLLKINSKSVTLRKTNQVVIEVPFSRLSDFDLAFVKKTDARMQATAPLANQASSIEVLDDDSTKIAQASTFDHVRRPTTNGVEIASENSVGWPNHPQPHVPESSVFSALATTERKLPPAVQPQESGLGSKTDAPKIQIPRLPTVSELTAEPTPDEATQPNREDLQVAAPIFNSNASSQFQIDPQVKTKESLVVGASPENQPAQIAWPNDSQFKPFQEDNFSSPRKGSQPQPNETPVSSFGPKTSNSSPITTSLPPSNTTQLQPSNPTQFRPSNPAEFQPLSAPTTQPAEFKLRLPDQAELQRQNKSNTIPLSQAENSQPPKLTFTSETSHSVFAAPPSFTPRNATYASESNLQLAASKQSLSDLPDYLRQVTSKLISTGEQADIRDALSKINANWPSQRHPVLASLVRQCIDSTDPETRKIAIETLALHDAELSLDYLAKGIEDDNFDVRWTTLKHVEKIANPRFIPVLARRLDSDDREKVASILESFGSSIENQVKPYVGHESVPVQLTACSLLGRVGSQQSLAALQSIVKTTQDRKVLLQAEAAIEQIMARKSSR